MSLTTKVHRLCSMGFDKCITRCIYCYILSALHFMGFDRCITQCIYCYSIKQNHFAALKNPLVLCLFCFLWPQILATTDLFINSIVSPFPECQIVGIIQYVAFSDRLFFTQQYTFKIPPCLFIPLSFHGQLISFQH